MVESRASRAIGRKERAASEEREGGKGEPYLKGGKSELRLKGTTGEVYLRDEDA